MKKFEHKNKDERRRVLLNNYHELSDNFDNQKLPNENEAVQGNGLGVMAKFGALTRKQLRAVIAILVAIAVVIPGMVAFIVKGASAAEGTHLDLSQGTESGNEITLTVGSGGMSSGLYNVTYDGRTYVYDLQFAEEGSQLNNALVAGDKVIFNTQTKKITWVYTPSHNSGWVDLTTLCKTPTTENGIASLKLKDTAALTSGSIYYYNPQGSDTYYLFEIIDEILGYKTADTSTGTGQNDSLKYYYERKITDPEKIISNDNPLTINIGLNDGTLEIVGDQLKRRQIYIKVNNFTTGNVYVLRNADGQLITGIVSNPSQNGLADKGSSHSSCGYSSLKHTYYNIESSNTPIISYGEKTLYDSSGTAYSSIEDYYDGGESEGELALSEFRARKYTHSVYYNKGLIGSDQTNVTGFYLFGYDSNTNRYTSDKTLGKMFNDTITDVKLYDLCEGNSRESNREYNHNDNSLWIYTNSKLTTNYRGDSSHDSTLQTGYLQKKSTDGYEIVSSTSDTFELYQRTSVYEETDYSGVDEDSVQTDKVVTKTISPKTITYDETESVDNGLELKKTVTDNGDDTFSLQLESWATSDKLVLPETDIVLILDTSKNMSNVLYNRNYENLNTYATFTPISLSNVSYNDFHDSSNKHNQNNLINMSNDYANNKYIEDPNNPGMYVYVSSTYKLQASLSNPHLYKYSFTDNYGNVYVSDPEWKGVSLFGSLNAFGSVDSIKFKLKTRAAGAPSDIKEEYTAYDMYTRTDSNTNYLNSNLYAVSREGGGPGLYYKHIDGKFYEVHVNMEADTFQASGLFNNQTVTQPVKYTYTVTIGDTVYKAVQGNSEYGAAYGVFQGFRAYVYDDAGDLTLDTTKDNLLSKSLYQYTGETNGVGNTEVTAFQAMKEAMEDFLLSSHYQSLTKKAGVNIALITYDKEPTVQYTLDKTKSNYTYVNKSVGDQSIDNMICAIYNYSITDTWASELGEAMAAARNELNTYSMLPYPENRRYAALFTAGVPADYTTFWWIDTSSATFDTGIADTAIANANRMKNEMDTTIYTVGLFDNADENKIYGKYWYYQFLNKVACTGKVNSYWGGSWVANFNYSMDPKDAYATNRMLAYISSDSSDIDTLGLTRGRYSPGTSSILGYLITRGYGYRINNAYKPDETGYYYGISPNTFDETAASEDASATSLSSDEVNAILNDVFSDLQEAMAVPNAVLGEDAELVDGITKYFQMVEDATVTAYVKTMDNQIVEELTPVISADGKTVRVSGFDYSKNYVTDGTVLNDEGNTGRKVVVTFDITREDDFIGGNDVPTNRTMSGIYDGPYGEGGVLEEKFDIPHADVSIIMDAISKDDATYYSNDIFLPDLLETKWTDGTNNAYVDIEYKFKDAEGTTINTYTIPAGESIGTWDKEMQNDGGNSEYINYQMLGTTEFTVECVVTPSIRGTVDSLDIKDSATNDWYKATVYVFKPHFDVENDTVDSAGDKYDLSTIPEQSWVSYSAEGEELTGTEKETAENYLVNKTRPNFTYDITDEAGTTTMVSIAGTLNEDGDGYTYTVTPSGYDGTTINATTDFKVTNVKVTPAAFTYEIEDVVEINYYEQNGSGDDATIDLLYSYDPQTDTYYNPDGTQADHDTAAATVANVAEGNTERINGIVTKTVNRQAVNATTNEDVTYLNTDDERTTGEFTISLNSHDVTITNHTIRGQEDADFSDKTKKFPLTLTLKNGNDLYSGDPLTYIDVDGETEKTLTFTNGQAVINLKDGETILLKDVLDGYTLTVTSNPDDNYYVAYQAATTGESLAAIGSDENEMSDPVTINDDKTIDVTHSIHEIVITGRGNADSKLNPFFIAAAVIALLGGSGTAYAVKRKKETEA